MEKMSINDFCKTDRIYAKLIQELFLHISVKELYKVLLTNADEKGEHCQAAIYRNTYTNLKRKVPGLVNMTVGDLLRYATEECLSEIETDSFYDEESMQLGYQIIKALLVDLFRPYAEKKQSSYRSVLEKVKKSD